MLVREGSKLVEMVAPSRRMIAIPMAADGRPSQDAFDPTTHARGGFGLFVPNLLEHLDHVRSSDLGNGGLADDRKNIGFQAGWLLGGVHRVLPSDAVLTDVYFHSLSECYGRGTGRKISGYARVSVFDQVTPFLDQFAALAGHFSGFRQYDIVERAESHSARRKAGPFIAEDPGAPDVALAAESRLEISAAPRITEVRGFPR
ncbi:MAG TPA: hypothetical protein VNZ93_23045 [Pseudorhodoplanes sp.]|nr:hypothetical protein [Pseudorhodoplanes sp.]HWV55457.1 hypothetical protein [Pseudorhodoplanes sp.]